MSNLSCQKSAQYKQPAIWFSQDIVDVAVSTNMGTSLLLKVFCYLSFYHNASFQILVPFKGLANFIGLPIDKHLGGKVVKINEVLNIMVAAGVILNKTAFQNVNDYIELDLNPSFFAIVNSQKHCLLDPNDIAEMSSAFKSFSIDTFKKVITYTKETYNRQDVVSTNKLLLVYMSLLLRINYRVETMPKHKWTKFPLAGLFTYQGLADDLDCTNNEIAAACKILRDDLKIIFYGENYKIKTQDTLRTLNRILVEPIDEQDNRLSWQLEYFNEHLAYVNYINKHKESPRYLCLYDIPSEIIDYINLKGVV